MSGSYEINLPDGNGGEVNVDFKSIYYDIVQSKNRITAIQKQKDLLDTKKRLSCDLETPPLLLGIFHF